MIQQFFLLSDIIKTKIMISIVRLIKFPNYQGLDGFIALHEGQKSSYFKKSPCRTSVFWNHWGLSNKHSRCIYLVHINKYFRCKIILHEQIFNRDWLWILGILVRVIPKNFECKPLSYQFLISYNANVPLSITRQM